MVHLQAILHQKLVKPKETPYGGAQLWWEGTGKVIASSPDDSDWAEATFKWSGYILVGVLEGVDLEHPAAPFLSSMRLTAKGR